MSTLRGRFEKNMGEGALAYTSSVPFDKRLYREDITGSIAHARMLAKQGIILEKEAELIVMALVSIREEIEKGVFQFRPELEDIHMNIEARLIEKVGDTGGKLHTARSRNDQVALDLRLFLKKAIADSVVELKGLQGALLDLAEQHREVAIPGYTHLQRAQPVLLAHHLLAYFEMLQRDGERFADCLKRADVLPLGSGALAGTPYPIDRDFLARELGFSAVSANSMDAVSDRDFVLEYEAAASICMMHLSRLAEEMVLWSSSEFGFIELDDAYTSSSSIMPQKKNPDVAELARGKTGRVYGNLLGLLTTMKALPLTYNRDMQEDKESLFDTVDTLIPTLNVLAGMVQTLKVNRENLGRALKEDVILATDLADYLVRKGASFREAHSVVSKLVSYAISTRKNLLGLKMEEYKGFSPLFDEEVKTISVTSSLASRNGVGGTSPLQVRAAIDRARGILRGKGRNP